MKSYISFVIFSAFLGVSIAHTSKLEFVNESCQAFKLTLITADNNNQTSIKLEKCGSDIRTTNGLQRNATDPGVFG